MVFKSIFLSILLCIKGALSCLRQFLAFGSSLKIAKIAFYSPQILALLSKYLNFCLYFLVMKKNDFIREIRLVLKSQESFSWKNRTEKVVEKLFTSPFLNQ